MDEQVFQAQLETRIILETYPVEGRQGKVWRDNCD